MSLFKNLKFGVILIGAILIGAILIGAIFGAIFGAILIGAISNHDSTTIPPSSRYYPVNDLPPYFLLLLKLYA